MGNKKEIKERLSHRYFGREVDNYETSRLSDVRDRDVFEKETLIVSKFLEDSIKGELLDVACGTGRVFPYYGNRKVYGIDISPDMLKIAKKRNSKAVLKVSRAEKIPFKNDRFAIAITSRFIMHTPDYKKVINEMTRVTKPKGSIIIDFPNKISFSYLTTKIRLILKIGTLKYFNMFSMKDIRIIAEENNLEIASIEAKTLLPAKILPKSMHSITKYLNLKLTKIFPYFSTPLYVRFIKN